MRTMRRVIPVIGLVLFLLACQSLGNTTPLATGGGITSTAPSTGQVAATDPSYPPDDGSRISVQIATPGQDTKTGFINRFGEVVIAPSFEWAGYFADNLAPVRIAENKNGYIDRQGNIVIQPVFTSARPFSEGAAFVSAIDANGTPNYGFIDIYGDYLIGPIEGEWPFATQDGSDSFSSSEKHYGEILFYDGFVVTNMTGNITYSGNYMNKNGDFMFEDDRLVWAHRFSEGLAVVQMRDGTIENPNTGYTAVIDITGKEIFRFDGHCPHYYSEGLLACGSYDTTVLGFIDRSGNMVIPATYDNALPFSEGLAAVEKDDQWGYIDTAGNLVIPFQFSDARPFMDGVALVDTGSGDMASVLNPSRGYINKAGEFVYSSFFGIGFDFNEGLAHIIQESTDGTPDMEGYIDSNGKLVFQVNE